MRVRLRNGSERDVEVNSNHMGQQYESVTLTLRDFIVLMGSNDIAQAVSSLATRMVEPKNG